MECQENSAGKSIGLRGLLLLALAALAACGGGGGSDPPAPPSPSGLSYTSPATFLAGHAISTLGPTVSGTPTAYSVSPGLPAGLAMDPDSGAISGTPTAVTTRANYRIMASNQGGNATFDLSLAVVTVIATPAAVKRIVAKGAPVTLSVALQPVGFSFPVGMVAKASEAAGILSSAVTVTGNASAPTLSLTVQATAATGHYSENVAVTLCTDSSCSQPLALPALSVPVDVLVMDSNSAWPGDHQPALSAWAGVPEWSTFQGNNAHTGHVPVSIDPNAFTTRWQATAVWLDDPWYGNLVSATTLNGMLYFGGTANVQPVQYTLFARDEATGALRWSHDFSSMQFASVNPPGTGNSTVYVAAGQQTSTSLFGFDAATGAPRFQSAMSAQWEHYLSPAVGASGVYTNAGTYGGLYGFDATGAPLFVASALQTSVWSPAVDATGVYFYTGSLTVIDPVTGAVKQSIADPGFQNYIYEIGGSAVLGAPGSVIAANYPNASLGLAVGGNSLIDFSLPLNAIVWRIAGNFPTTPAYANGIIYAPNLRPLQLEARSETDGSLLWSWIPPQADDTGFASEVLLTDSLVFVSTNLAVYGVDLATHMTVFSYPASGRLALSPNGILYITASGRPLVAINVK
jgi:hypothetical protein